MILDKLWLNHVLCCLGSLVCLSSKGTVLPECWTGKAPEDITSRNTDARARGIEDFKNCSSSRLRMKNEHAREHGLFTNWSVFLIINQKKIFNCQLSSTAQKSECKGFTYKQVCVFSLQNWRWKKRLSILLWWSSLRFRGISPRSSVFNTSTIS